MKFHARRRLWSVGVFLIVAVSLCVIHQLLEAAHLPTSFISGWLLLGMIVFLAAFGIRKKFSFLPASVFPIGTAAIWLQLHLYVGLLTSVVFVLHIGLRFPNGLIETTLALFYVGTFLSGVAGLAFSRLIPRRLTARGEEILFERIPIFRKQVREEVEELSGVNSEASEPTALIDIYESQLKQFFTGPKNILKHLLYSERPRHLLLQHMQGCRQFLSEEEQPKMDRIVQLIETKDHLDFHYALQGILKVWLFVHLPLTYGLLVIACFHALLVHAFL